MTLLRKNSRHTDNVTRAWTAGAKALHAEVERNLSEKPPLTCDQCGKRIWTVFPGHLCRECAKDAA